MKSALISLAVFTASSFTVLVPNNDVTTPNGTTVTGGISSVEAEKRQDGDRQDASSDVETSSAADSGSENAVYQLNIACFSDPSDAVCSNPVTCDDPPGAVLYTQLISINGGPFEVVQTICLRPEDVDETSDAPPVVTPALVAEEFTRLSWPASTLQVQPPGGRTLVNLTTNFYTADVGAQVQAVTLLGQAVEIEATPTTWTWVHGDGTTQTTDRPGSAYPGLDITHTYTDGRVTVTPRVDTTYAGRFRVNGGPWATIPTTVTVAGAPAQLEVVTARPQLVGVG